MEASQGQIGEEVPRVSFGGVVFEAVVGEVGMRGQRDETDSDTSHEEDVSLG